MARPNLAWMVSRGTPVVGTLLVAACSFTLDVDDPQCKTDRDCDNRGIQNAVCVSGSCRAQVVSSSDGGQQDAPSNDPVWGCLGKSAVVPEEKSAPVSYRLRLFDAVALNGIADLTLVACEKADTECTAPLAGSTTKTDGNGRVDVPVYSGFKGFFKVTPPSGSDVIPSYIFASPIPQTGVTVPPRDLAMVTFSSLGFLTSQTGQPAKDELGHVLYVATSCTTNGVGGVRITASPTTGFTQYFYTDGTGFPSVALQTTESSGGGGIINLTPGNLTITARRDTDGIKVSEASIAVHAKSISYIIMTPL